MNHALHIRYVIILLIGLYLAGCKTTPEISYQRDVRPVFADKCVDCHAPPYGEGYRKTGLNLESYKSLMQGSIYGPVVVPGNSKRSPLNMLIEGRAGDLSREMKNRHTPMTEHEIEVLQLWVEQGARDN
jgi:hypothetical protein